MKRNPALISALSGEFQRSHDHSFAWKTACAAIQALLGLRGFWPMSSFNEAGNAYDLSEQGRVLTYNGNPTYNFAGLAPYIDLDGTNDYLSRADEAGLDITGGETYVAAAIRGLTIGGWFYVDTLAQGSSKGFIGKWNSATNNRSYILFFDNATNTPNFSVSGNGVAWVTETGAAMSALTWYFLCGRFNPSGTVDLFVNSTLTVQAGAPAAIFNSNADLNVGAYNNGAAGTRLNGRASMCFLCVPALSNGIIRAVYHHTRALFGV